MLQANNVATTNAAAMVVINNGDEGEELFRVAATLGGRSGGGEEPKGPERMATVSLSHCRADVFPQMTRLDLQYILSR